jgi:hypothetical protein
MKEAGPSCVLEDLQLTGIIAYLLEADLPTPNLSSGAKKMQWGPAFRRVRACPMRRAAHR